MKQQIVQVTQQRAQIIVTYEVWYLYPVKYLALKILQKMLRQVIDLQVEATKHGLAFLRVGAKKIALENIFKVQEADLKKAMDDFKAGASSGARS